ncbi:hypothetical protein Syun_006700 [Stephania yunnanensis]|uniref:Uncharacterized protein n=1 Tax=Stephania yunnanensis TaxID=152371 RepID=A0AAP0PZK0_9MAGN
MLFIELREFKKRGERTETTNKRIFTHQVEPTRERDDSIAQLEAVTMPTYCITTCSNNKKNS